MTVLAPVAEAWAQAPDANSAARTIRGRVLDEEGQGGSEFQVDDGSGAASAPDVAGGTGGQQMVHKTFDLDPEAGFAVLEFDMHAIDTWDMENMFVFLNDEVVSQRNFSIDGVPPGTYQFRLVVVDTTGNFPEPCVVNLIVQ